MKLKNSTKEKLTGQSLSLDELKACPFCDAKANYWWDGSSAENIKSNVAINSAMSSHMSKITSSGQSEIGT
jgi:hypothetical protein